MTSLKETAIEPRFSSRITPMDTTNPGKRSTLPSHNPCKLLSPWEIPALLNPFAAKHGQLEKVTVMYSGNMGRGHDIDSVIAAAGRLQRREDLDFLFIGSGPKVGLVEAAASTLPNVRLLPWQPDDQLCYSLAAADIGIVALEPELGATSLPSKTFWYAAAGAAIIAICPPESDLADLVTHFGCGFVIGPGQEEQLATTIAELASRPDELRRLRQRSWAAAEELGGPAGRQRVPLLLQTAFQIRPRACPVAAS